MRKNPKKRPPKSVKNVSQMVKIVQDSSGVFELPPNTEMSDKQWTFFKDLYQLFTSSERDSHTIMMLVFLSKAMDELESERQKLTIEGHIIEVKDNRLKGIKKKIVNPRKQSVKMCMQEVLSLRKSLGLHATADKALGDLKRERRNNIDLETKLTSELGDDLIPTLN